MNVPKTTMSSGPSIRGFFHRKAAAAVTLVLAAALAAPALAQAPLQGAPLPPSVPPAGSPIERMAPRPLPAVSATGIDFGALDKGEVPNVSIAIRQVQVSGATMFQTEIAAYTADLTGPAVPLPRLNEARQKILLHYRERGFAFVSVSLSVDPAPGVARFKVVEGHIVAVKLEGDIGPAGAMILRFLHRLIDGEPVNTGRLEKYVLLAQDVPGVSLSTVLEQSKTDPGALTLVAQVGRSGVPVLPGSRYGSLSGYFSMDNRAFDLTGPMEALAGISVAGLTSLGDKTDFSFFHSFPNSQNFGQISSEWYVCWPGTEWDAMRALCSSGLKFKIYGGAGVSTPTGSLAALKYNGVTNIFGAQLTLPVIRSRQQNLNVYTALDMLESTVYTGAVAAQSSADQVRSLRFGAEYVLSDQVVDRLLEGLPGGKHAATNQLQVRVSRGLDFLGGFHGTALPPSTARSNERHNFTALKLEASRIQTIYTLDGGGSFALMGLATGQWSNDILPPSEQFYLGGARFNRGYYAGQAPGDKALAATAELQFNTILDLSWAISQAEVASQFYVFYDWGQTWQNQSTDSATRLVSAGSGVRLQITKYVELDLEAVARMTKRPPPSQADLNGIGLYWRVLGRF